MKNPPKSGIIKREDGRTYFRVLDTEGKEKYRYLQTDAIQKLDSPEAIAKYFEYTDKDGVKHSPITKEFSALKLDVQKEAAEGIAWAQKYLKLEALPEAITTARLWTGIFGEYSETYKALRFRKGIKNEQAFATAIHEMTHYADQMTGHVSGTIVKQAIKKLGIRKTSKAFINNAFAIAGKNMDSYDELVAFSIECYAMNSKNPLANEIARLFHQRRESQ